MLERQFYSLLGPVLCDAFINNLGMHEVPHQLQLPLPHLPQQDPGSAPLGVQTPVPKAFFFLTKCSAWAAMAFCRLGLCSAAWRRGSRGAGWVMSRCKASLCLSVSSAHL